MRGHILTTDATGGVIAGADGNRYTFARTDWKGGGEPPGGTEVDFIAREGVAAEIFPLPGAGVGLGGASVAPAAVAAAPQRDEGSSVMLGIIGILCLALGFVIPFIPTIAAFILGLIGADSAKRHDNSTGLIASRIAWIGAVVFFVLGVAFLVIVSIFAWPFLEIVLNYMWHIIQDEAAKSALA